MADYMEDIIVIEIQSYIIFKKDVSLPSLPPGFAVVTDERLPPMQAGKLMIEKNFNDNDDKYALMREIAGAMEQLYQWALSLPDNN